MKKTLITLLLLTFSIGAKSQEIKKIQKRDTIGFLSKQSIPFFAKIIKADKYTFVAFELEELTKCNYCAGSVEIGLENSDVVHLSNIERSTTENQPYLTFLNSEDLAILKSSPIKRITIRTDDGEFEINNITANNYFQKNLN